MNEDVNAPAPALTEDVQALIGSMVSELRQHRCCGDAYPEGGWPGVVQVLADYAAFKRASANKPVVNVMGRSTQIRPVPPAAPDPGSRAARTPRSRSVSTRCVSPASM